jgi:hypothetical protein
MMTVTPVLLVMGIVTTYVFKSHGSMYVCVTTCPEPFRKKSKNKHTPNHFFII